MDTKLTVTFTVPGAKMLSEEECMSNPRKNYDFHRLKVDYVVLEGEKRRTVSDILEYNTRKNSTITQVINMTDEAYNDFISSRIPEWWNIRRNGKWTALSTTERLTKHLDRIKDTLGALSYTYIVAQD